MKIGSRAFMKEINTILKDDNRNGENGFYRRKFNVNGNILIQFVRKLIMKRKCKQ